jgi:hypothetical protein
MTVTSGEYVLAVPDYSDQTQQNRHHQDGNNTMFTRAGERHDSAFKKVILKVSNVEWTVGLVFERNTDGGGRSFDFAPHYKVILRNPKQMGTTQLQVRLAGMTPTVLTVYRIMTLFVGSEATTFISQSD